MDLIGLFSVLVAGAMLVVGGLLILLMLGYLLVGVVRLLTTDWFGIKYEDKHSPYYHDKTGQGRGH